MVAHDIGRAKTLPTENPQPQLGRLDALDLEADQGAAHDAVTEQGLAEAIDWRGRSTGKQRQRFLGVRQRQKIVHVPAIDAAPAQVL